MVSLVQQILGPVNEIQSNQILLASVSLDPQINLPLFSPDISVNDDAAAQIYLPHDNYHPAQYQILVQPDVPQLPSFY